ncbi:MAG: tRNA (adenosine(37)-N6)-threonylcarbamoyltransferase complex dimerization subunit type 1 TsaB [Candidatus Microsaccharimonas sossegonensis]|uniref:tRNA (Adenosine(37)-N6)-threonylcarbamoyltransferase complex dimerization subunit type 1 TsaB n=1 Tax=Candidatus Microsaccharimonas sossegonensis TaxID=2506948 RepID=A0A4Q0AGZ3_9BACT|nr:MAG: tRNA (adenosine(37)-N6)-threonylcarbamoyltransferase complex dimerization subunit type 1 TsaB [Candidatus Microsaccharimonas sossegonensis]
MIVLLDTSTPVCKVSFVDSDWRVDDQWEAGRTLAKGLLGYLQASLKENGKTWADISGIVAFKGPGSFTGLRIGLTVLNTFADSEKVSIVGTTGDRWQKDGLERLARGDNDKLVMPEYGVEVHITAPRK